MRKHRPQKTEHVHLLNGIPTSKGGYFNTNTNPVNVNFKYKAATDNPENPNYIKNVKHSGGDVTIE